MKKTAQAITVAIGAALVLSACSTGINGNPNDKQESKSFSSAKDGAGILPNWIPDSATDIKEVIRTTGSERIIVMKNGTLPNSCKTLPAGQKPVPVDDAESETKANEYRTGPATLQADWWPVGIEQKATSQCGKWWVTVDGDYTYAYSPELKAVI